MATGIEDDHRVDLYLYPLGSLPFRDEALESLEDDDAWDASLAALFDSAAIDALHDRQSVDALRTSIQRLKAWGRTLQGSELVFEPAARELSIEELAQELGVEPFLVASSLLGVLAQRLIRTLCPNCKQPYAPSPEEARGLGIHSVPPGTMFYREVGCDQCLKTGYRGRKGSYELLIVTDEIRGLVVKNVDASTIKKAAIATGTKLLLDDGARNVLLGRSSAEEVLRVATDEEMVLEM